MWLCNTVAMAIAVAIYAPKVIKSTRGYHICWLLNINRKKIARERDESPATRFSVDDSSTEFYDRRKIFWKFALFFIHF